MAIWTNDPNINHDIYTVVYLLKDALRSSLEDALFFSRTTCPKPDVRGAGHAEIAARLGRFRNACSIFMEREALLLTKLVRARIWAIELRRLAPDLQAEVEQFLNATAECHRLQGEFIKDAQSMFHGGGSLSRFVAQRQPDDGVSGQEGGIYLVGGRAAIYELKAACEVLLAQINEEFFKTEQENIPVPALSPVFLYLEAAEEQAPSSTGQSLALQ